MGPEERVRAPRIESWPVEMCGASLLLSVWGSVWPVSEQTWRLVGREAVIGS